MAAVMLGLVALGAISLGVFLWVLYVTDDSLLVLVNQSDGPVHATVQAEKVYAVDLAPGERRRLPHHAYGEISFALKATLPSGRIVSSEGPYHATSYDFAEDGPDEEHIVSFGRDSFRILDLDDISSVDGGEEIARAAGYQTDQRLPSPSGRLDAVLRDGPSLGSDHTWRIVLAKHAGRTWSGSTALEGTGDRPAVNWGDDEHLRIAVERGRVLWARRSVAPYFATRPIQVSVKTVP